MKKFIKKIAVLTLAILPVAGVARAEQPAALTDSVTEAAAVFATANMKNGIDMLLDNIRQMGLEADSARLVQMVSQGILRPLDEAAYRRAGEYLTSTAERLSSSRERQFLDAAAARPGAEVLDGGLVLETLEPGNGATIVPSDVVVFNYRGALPDGTVFDDTAASQPLTTQASNLVPGMTQGLTHMRTGGTYRLSIPSALAYGSRGAGGVIPPDTPLEFTIQIVEIQPAH